MEGPTMLALDPIPLVTPIVTSHPMLQALSQPTPSERHGIAASNHLCDFVTLVTPPTFGRRIATAGRNRMSYDY
jgi:hypothetical protein